MSRSRASEDGSASANERSIRAPALAVAEAPRGKKALMDVVTLNLWGHEGDWPRRRDALASGFRALAPDLVALQETIVTEDTDQVRELLGDGFAVVHSQRRDPSGMGISIASR